MRISSKGQYALQLMLDLAQNRQEGFIALAATAKRKDISKKYLEQVVPALTKAGLIQANRGVQGGYKLLRRPEQYTLADIFKAAEPALFAVNPTDAQTAYLSCVWQGLEKSIEDYLSSLTLQDILQKQLAFSADNYVI